MIVYRRGLLRLVGAADPEIDCPIAVNTDLDCITPFDRSDVAAYGVNLTDEEWAEYQEFCLITGPMMLWWAWSRVWRTGKLEPLRYQKEPTIPEMTAYVEALMNKGRDTTPQPTPPAPHRPT